MPHDLRELYTSRRWRKRRAHQLRVQPLCEQCLANGRTVPADTVDHIEAHGGDVNKFWLGRLRSLCRPCHEIRHGRMRAPRTIGVDGWPIEAPSVTTGIAPLDDEP